MTAFFIIGALILCAIQPRLILVIAAMVIFVLVEINQ